VLIFQPLSSFHDRKSFDCGVPALNEFLQKTARQHREKGLSNTYVMLDEENPEKIVGYFTLAFFELSIKGLPEQYSRKLPKSSNLPAAKLARLAVEKSCQGRGYGALILVEAIKRVLSAASESGAITGFFVDAKDEQAKRFYLRYDFIPLQDAPLKLFLPLKTLLSSFNSGET
jgi:GNAT superfamily N-acetyltransferase